MTDDARNGFPCFGTLHLGVCGRKQFVMCSDSRGHSASGPAGDHFQKLFQAGTRTLCGIAGVLTLSPDLFVSDRIQTLCSTNTLRDSPHDLLSAIAHDIQDELTELFSEQPLPDLPSAFNAFCLRRESDGLTDLRELEFPIEVALDGSRVLKMPRIKTHIDQSMPKGPFYFPLGNSHCLSEQLVFERMILDADLPDRSLLGAVDRVFEKAMSRSESCRDEVGGPIDVAAIGSNGFRWLRRK